MISRKTNDIIYQIYPFSFYDSNRDGYGDLQGVIHKLDYFTDLGIDTIWLSPIFVSPMKDFGYDIVDYCAIDPKFGTMNDFDKLIKKFHEKGIKILLDYVPNHTSDQHPWFKESRSSTSNQKRDWYVWKKGKGEGIPPNNWISAFGGPSWEYDEATDEWYLHDFLKEQPDLNWRNPQVKKEMFNVLDFWLQKGVDGFRFDALAFLFEDPLLRDDPINNKYDSQKQIPWDSLRRKYDFNLPEVKSLIYEIAEFVSRYPNKILLTEIYDNLDKLKDMYFTTKTTTNIPFNFDLMFLPWDVQEFKNNIEKYDKAIGLNNTPNYVLSNHDQPRIATRVGKAKAKLLALMQLTLRGIPIIYYGDELGMENSPIDTKNMKDPLGTHVAPQFCRDPYRTPMQWNSSANTGFSDISPWLPIHPNHPIINVNSEEADPNSMLNLYKELIGLRKKYKSLDQGILTMHNQNNKNLLCFERIFYDEKILVLVNFADSKEIFSYRSRTGRILLSCYGKKNINDIMKIDELVLNPLEGLIIQLS